MIGRNYTHQTMSERRRLLRQDKFNFNPFIASGAIGMCIDDFNGDNFDHGPLGFVGGGYMGQVQTNGRPDRDARPCRRARRNGARSGRTRVRDNYLSTVKPALGVHGSIYSYRDVYLDLDPTYKDRFGRPLMRMTIDFHDNELKRTRFLTDKLAEIIKAMGAKRGRQATAQGPLRHHASTRRRISTAAPSWATDPKTSALNRYLQSWDVPNLFVHGRERVSAERRLQPDRHGGRARLSGRRTRSATNI